tara:strand:+ start:2051 stop:2830 length:780 start_codon:yes stop_codon:yes gene_type:complete
MSEMIRITARDPVNNKYEEIQGTDGGGLLTAAMGNTVADGSGDNKHMLVNSSGHQSVVIESGATPAITGFSTATLQGAGLPAALSAASNLKVSVEEIASGTLATSALQGAGLPAALDSGSLKVAIQSGATPAITGFATATLQGAGLPAALSAASNLKVSVEESSPARTSVQNNSGVVAGAAVLSTIDARSYRSLRLFGDATASFKVQGSIDNSNFYNVVSVYPDEDSNFSVTVDKVPPYVRIQNDATSQTMVVESALMD